MFDRKSEKAVREVADDLTSWSMGGHRSLADLSAEFIRTKRAAGCSVRTLEVYEFWLGRIRTHLSDEISALDNAGVTWFLTDLRERKLSASTVHQAYRTLKTFARWLVGCGALSHSPLDGLRVKMPVTLPQIPSVEELRAVLGFLPDTLTGRRNKAAILVMADSGVRSEELRRLRIEHLNLQTGSVLVRGKGARDRVVFVSAPTLEAIRDCLAMRQGACGSDYIFVDTKGRPLKARHLVTVLHRLSARAGLPINRRLHPHSIRHWAGTNWIRAGMGLDQVRRLLGHSTISTTLIYVSLSSTDLQEAHRNAGVIDRMGILPARNRAARGRGSDERTSPSVRTEAALQKTRYE
jgi:site-specific recombinase XerD